MNSVLPALLCLALASGLFAQTASTGAISGTVRDSSQAVVPGVTVKVTHVDAADSRTTMTDDQGNYAVRLLAPGRYRIEFTLPAFKTIIREGVTVAVTETVTVNETLTVAGLQSDTVSVTAEGEILQTNTVATGRVVDSETITTLPLATRNFTQLTSLSPGTSAPLPDTLAIGSGSQNVFANGGSQLSNNYTINGASATNSVSSSAIIDLAFTGIAVPSIDSIQEFKVQTSMYDAAYGQKSGANINIVTRSGTSEFHGGAYEFLRNNALNANNFFFNSLGTPRPVLRQNQFGGTLGGPVIKNKTFFFISYEGMRQTNGASNDATSTLVLPAIPVNRTAASIGAAFANQAGVRGGLAVDPSGSNIHPVALRILTTKLPNGDYLLPSPQRSGAGTNYAVSIPADYNQDQFNVNIDQQLTQKNRLTGKHFFSTSLTGLGFFQNNIPGFPSLVDAGNQNASLSDTHVFGPKLLNEVRAGFARFTGANSVELPLKDSDIGVFRSSQGEFPGFTNITVTGAFQMGGPQNQSRDTTNVYSLADTVSFSFSGRGRHELRAGTETRHEQANLDVQAQRNGLVTFSSFPDFLLGRAAGAIASGGNGTTFSNINSVRITTGLTYHGFRYWDQAFYLADDWKVSPRVTFNLGLRYEILGNVTDKDGLITSYDPRYYAPPPPGGVTSAGFIMPENSKKPVAGVRLVSDSLLDTEDRNNFAPRVGFAYRLRENGDFVLRGGYGVFYERLQTRPLLNSLAYTSLPWAVASRPSGAANAASSFDRPFADLPPLTAFPVPIEAPSRTSTKMPLTGQFINPVNRTPYIQQYNLNVQWKVRRDLLAEVGFSGSKGTKLVTSFEVNQAYLASPSRPVNGLTTNSSSNAANRQPFEGFATLRGHHSVAISNYNSLQASLTKRFSRGLSFLASYTFSRSLSTVSTGNADGQAAFQSPAQDQYDLRNSGYGLQNFDRPHRFVYSFLYGIPFSQANRVLHAVLGGWQAAGIVTLQSGTPFSIVDTRGGTLYAVAGDSRASFAPGASVATATLSGSTQSRLNGYFNTAAFIGSPTIAAGGTTPDGFPVSAPGGTIFGNTGRNIMRGPGQRGFDLLMSKHFKLSEKTRLEFRSEFFNIFNLVNFGNPGNNIATPASFGVINNTSSSPRVLQFALKVRF
jgi:outer membrane receptor protein involved in Fe transport